MEDMSRGDNEEMEEVDNGPKKKSTHEGEKSVEEKEGEDLVDPEDPIY